MDIPLRIGEAPTIVDPATGEPISVIVTAIGDGRATITVVARPDVPVTKVGEPQSEPPPHVIH